MKRSNSRNNSSARGKEEPNKKQTFAQTSKATKDKKNRQMNGNSRQVPFITDLYKGSTQRGDEIHQLMGEIEMPPDDSLTISSMSQSPFQPRGRHHLSQTNGTHENSNDNDGTLGRSELEATYTNDINKTGTNKSLSITRRNDHYNQTSQSYLEEEEDHSQEYSPSQDEDPSHLEDYDRSYLKQQRISRRQRDNDESSQIDQSIIDHSHFDQSVGEGGNGRDSPDFNRHNPHNNSTYDLTISQTAISNQNATYRGISDPDTKRGSTNRTFADHVQNQQYNHNTSSSNNNTHRNHASSNQETSRVDKVLTIPKRNYKNDEGALISTDEGFQESVEEEDDEDDVQRDDFDEESKDDIDASDQSAIESFAQTQYSKYFSRMGHSRFTHRGDRTNQHLDDLSMKRSPVALQRNTEHDESLSLTPSTNDNKWQTQKSYINPTPTANNRTTGSDNPLNRITTNIHTNLKTNRTANYETNNMFLHGSGVHNRSMQRDQELEKTLEEHSKHHTLESIEDSQHSQVRKVPSKVVQLKTQLSNLTVENNALQAQISSLANECEQKDGHLDHMEQQMLSTETQLRDCQEHLLLLQTKCKDESSLIKLRGKNLDQVQRQLKQLKVEILSKDQNIHMLEQKIQRMEQDDQVLFGAQQEEMQKQLIDIHKKDILLKSKVREIEELKQLSNANILQVEQHFQKQIKQSEQQLNKAEIQMDALQKQLKDLTKTLNKKDQELDSRVKQIYESQSVCDQKDKMLATMEKEKDKYQQEMKSFKDKCKSYEQELEQIRGFENNSMFGNSVNYGNVTNQQSKKNDYELKQMKDVFDKKLNKATEDLSKKTLQVKDLELDLQKLREELKRAQHEKISSTSEQLDKHDELILELKKVKQDLEQHQQLEQDLRFCFNLEPREDIGTKLSVVSQDLESIPLLKRELDKITGKYREVQQQLVDAQSKDSKGAKTGQMSNFQKNLLMEKENQIQQLRRQLESEDEVKSKIQSDFDRLDISYQAMSAQYQELQSILSTLQAEHMKLKDHKDKSDRNVEELKEKLRVLIREQQDHKSTQRTIQEDPALKQKYEDLIQLILALDLAIDPLHSVNLSLQQSFLDEFEQARKHLEDQVRLVTDVLAQHNKDKRQLLDQVSSLELVVKDKCSQLDMFKKELQKVSESVREKERVMEVNDIEMKQMSEACERMNKQLREVEGDNARVRQQLEQANSDMRKLLRTQEHLHKDKKVAPVKGQDMERLMMVYEDQLSRSSIKNQTVCEQEILDQREHYRNEVIDMLDKLIDSKSTKLATFNDLALQLTTRLDKVRSQEKLKFTDTQQKSLKSSQCENQIVETFKQEMDSINNEDELVQSLAKWMKSSQINTQLQHQAKNFFAQEDNNSLLFSDLQQPQPKENPLQGRIESLEQEVQKREQQVEVCEGMIKEFESTVKELRQELQAKEMNMRESQEVFSMRSREQEDQVRAKNQEMWREVQALKESIKDELTAKSQMLDLEYEEMEQQKVKDREVMKREQQEMEQKYRQKTEQVEREFMNKLQNMELEIKNSHEKNKDELLSNVYKNLEEQNQTKIKLILEEHQQTMQALKVENGQKIEDLKRVKEREMKRMKEESERVKKSAEDKCKKLELEWLSEKEQLEREHKDKLEGVNAKNKKEIKAAQEKVRAELRNQVASVKNEMAKAKAEFEREKKKLVNDGVNAMEQAKREYEDQLEQDMKVMRDKLEKQHKKKMEVLVKEQERKLEEIDGQLVQIQEIHKEELKKERERLEVRLREQLRGEVKMEVQTSMEDEYREQLERIRQQQMVEIDKIKTKYEVMIREERASMLPTTTNITIDKTPNKEFRNAEIQVNTILALEESQVNQSYYSQMSHIYVDQLKVNFEEELERQQQIFEVQLIAKQQTSVRIFEEILTLEFDKILQSIFHKASINQNQSVLDFKRKEINTLISDILNRNDDRKDKQMKSSLENLKKKISEVLRVFKQELETKLNKKNEVIMKERLQNMSDIVSNQEQFLGEQEFSSQYTSGNEMDSRVTSQQPTPRHDTQSRMEQPNFNIIERSNEKQQYSDIKKYISEDQEEPNILKQVTPVANAQGVLVVEVDKVIRDLKMLFNTVKQSKFYILLMNIDELSQKDNKAENIAYNNEATLVMYRSLLNDFLKMIVKMNNGAEQMGKSNEVYKLKLLNNEMVKQLKQLQQEHQGRRVQAQIEETLRYYYSKPSLCSEAQSCLKMMENAQFLINKQQFRLYQLLDLFFTEEELNTNTFEVNQNCLEYASHNPLEVQANDQLLLSQFSPDKKLTPEMLSPEETAQLIAQVFSNLNQTQANLNNQNQPLDTYQSFFQTFLSNDDYIKSAENFIQKYREQLNFTQKYKNMPLQVNPREQYSRTNHFQNRHHQSVQLQNLNKKRCRSHSNNSNSSQLPLQQQHQQSYVSNVFQSNMLDKQSLNSYQPMMMNNYESQSQGGNQSFLQMQRNQSASTIFNNAGKANQPYQSLHNKHHNLNIEDVSCTQSNVNALFERLKSNFQTHGSASKDHSFR